MNEARTELAHFLRTKRHHVSPAAVGLEDHGRRRTPGLRREEVSLLSGVSLTWYTWLEQARDITPSRQVVDALAKTLRLTEAEHSYVLRLVGQSAPRPQDDVDQLPAHAQQLLDALGDSPAYAITPTWFIIGWNSAYQAFYPGIAAVPPEDRNLLWLVFTDQQVQSLHTHWDVDSRHFLAQFRAETGPRIHQPPVARLVERLRQASPDFRAGWAGHGVEQFSARERQFRHPVVGDLHLAHHRLSLTDDPGIDLVVYTAVPGTGTAERLAQMQSDPDEVGPEASNLHAGQPSWGGWRADARRRPGPERPSCAASQR
ncbi:helix-turn-helix transcriptional regulator [Blastococcus montanus]|uniref:helix-turn-helix transcriptional regulator n=1 Tax=Blastococcus montanus TaxID=3144973 RepID=UPI00320B7441